jgi:hypothetical protein
MKSVLLIINLAPCHQGVWRIGDIAPPFLTSAQDGYEWSASGPRRFTPEGRVPGTPLHRRLDEPHCRSGGSGLEKTFPFSGIETRSSFWHISIPTELSRFFQLRVLSYVGVPAWLIIRVWIGWLDLLHLFHKHLENTDNYSAIDILHSLQFIVANALGFSVFISPVPATDFSPSDRNFTSHKVFISRPNYFLAIILKLPVPNTTLATLDYPSLLFKQGKSESE